MTKILNRFARPLMLMLALGVAAQPVLAQDRLTQERLAATAANILSMFDSSATGSYMAGQQALQDLRTDEAARYFAQAARDDWGNAILVERAFVGYAADGQIGQAAETARHLLDIDENNDLARLILATEAIKERRYGAANDELAALGNDTFTAITGDILRAWALVGAGKAEQADKRMVDLGRDGLADFLVFHRALLAEASGDTEKALTFAEQAFNTEPNVARIAEVYARMLANADRFDEARDVIAQFEAQGISHPIVSAVKEAVEARRHPGVFTTSVQTGAAEMYHGIGVALARDGSLDLGLVFLRLALYLDPNADVVSLALGSLLDTADQREAANEVYNAVPANSIMKPMAVVRIAQNLDALGDREEAIRRLSNVVSTQPNDIDAVAVLGDMYRYDEQFAKAAESYSKAIELSGGENPTDWRYYYVRGIAYERDKDWPAAEADFLKALELNPDQPQVLNYLGYSWIDKDMHLDEALGMIEKAVEAVPQDGFVVDSLGWAFYKLGRLDEAVETLEKAVQLQPNDPELNDHLGDAYWRVGRRLEARFQWNIAASVDTEGAVKERTAVKLAEGLSEDSASR